MLAASTDNYTLDFNGNAKPRQQGRQDRDKQLRLYITCCFLPLHFMGDHQSGKGICQLVHAFGQYVPLLRVQEDACSRRAMWQRLAWSSHTACMLTAPESLPFFPGFSSPSFSYHSLQTPKSEGCSSSSWCFETASTSGTGSALLQQALPSCYDNIPDVDTPLFAE